MAEIHHVIVQIMMDMPLSADVQTELMDKLRTAISEHLQVKPDQIVFSFIFDPDQASKIIVHVYGEQDDRHQALLELVRDAAQGIKLLGQDVEVRILYFIENKVADIIIEHELPLPDDWKQEIKTQLLEVVTSSLGVPADWILMRFFYNYEEPTKIYGHVRCRRTSSNNALETRLRVVASHIDLLGDIEVKIGFTDDWP